MTPLPQKERRTDPTFFEIPDLTLKFRPVPAEEKGLRAKFATLGIGTEEGFDADALSPEYARR